MSPPKPPRSRARARARSLSPSLYQDRRLRRALDVFPASADLNCVYGDLQYFLKHDAHAAFTHYKVALDSDPKHVPAACGLATVMLALGIERTGGSASVNGSDDRPETNAPGAMPSGEIQGGWGCSV